MNRRDMILISVILVLAAVSYFVLHHGEGDGVASVYVHGRLYGTYDLSVPQQIHIEGDNGIINDIEISDGSIFMKYSTCPGQQCVDTGRISSNNESICCAPAGTMITVHSAKEPDYDAITK